MRLRAHAILGLSAKLSRSIGSIIWNIAEGAQIADAEVQVGRPVER